MERRENSSVKYLPLNFVIVKMIKIMENENV